MSFSHVFFFQEYVSLVKYFHLLVVTWPYLSKFKCFMTLDVLFSNAQLWQYFL